MTDPISVWRYSLHRMLCSRHLHPSHVQTGLSDILTVLDCVLQDLYSELERQNREIISLKRQLESCNMTAVAPNSAPVIKTS
jgi:hypothetical protein